MSTGLALLVAAAAMLTGIVAGWTAPRIWLAATLTGLGAALVAGLAVLGGGTEWVWRSGFWVGGERVYLRLDAISALFLVLLCVVGGAASVYAREYWADDAHPRSARSGRVWWNVMLLNLGIVLLASNGLHFLIAWEIFSLGGLFSDHAQPATPRGARGGLALPWGIARGGARAVRVFHPAGGAHRKLGTRSAA